MKKYLIHNSFIALAVLLSLSISSCSAKKEVIEQPLVAPVPQPPAPVIEEPKVEEVKPAEVTPPPPQETYEVMENSAKAAEAEQEIEEKVEEIEVKDRIFFAYDSSEVSSDARQILDTQSEWLNSDQSVKVIIEGHCDERGTREYNIALGEKRANATKRYLVSKGVDSGRVKIISYGKERPVAFGNNEDSLAKNRRSVTVIQ